jgi:hypothetical protein
MNWNEGIQKLYGRETETAEAGSVQRVVSCDVWNVQQLAAGERWNTLLSENNQSDAERAVNRLAKSGERNLRIQGQRAANEKAMRLGDENER